MASKMPKGGGGSAPKKVTNPSVQSKRPGNRTSPAASKQMNTSMTKPGAGSRGSGKGPC